MKETKPISSNPPSLKLYPESIIRREPSHISWCETTEELWKQIEPRKEFCYVGTMTLKELFLFCSHRGEASKPFLKWWNRKTIKRHIDSFFKKTNSIDFPNIPKQLNGKRYMKMSSMVKLLQDLPIRNQISVIVTDEVVELHPGGTRLALKDYYTDPVPVFIYSKLPLDVLTKVTKDNIKILNAKSCVQHFNGMITVTPPTESYGVNEFDKYHNQQYRKTEDKVIVDNVVYFLKQEGEWIINPNLHNDLR